MTRENEVALPQTENSADPTSAEPTVPKQGEVRLSLTQEELKALTKSAVDQALKELEEQKLVNARKELEDYNNKIAEAVKTSQASIIKTQLPHGQQSLEYVQGVLSEDARLRSKHPEGKAHYSQRGEDFLKAKIILLKKIGLSEEEIAKEVDTMV